MLIPDFGMGDDADGRNVKLRDLWVLSGIEEAPVVYMLNKVKQQERLVDILCICLSLDTRPSSLPTQLYRIWLF